MKQGAHLASRQTMRRNLIVVYGQVVLAPMRCRAMSFAPGLPNRQNHHRPPPQKAASSAAHVKGAKHVAFPSLRRPVRPSAILSEEDLAASLERSAKIPVELSRTSQQWPPGSRTPQGASKRKSLLTAVRMRAAIGSRT